jgi:formate-dependent nitrite reductase membrane component NrfD
MDTDLILVVGIVAIVLAVPTLLSAWVEGSVPRAGAILVLIGGVLIVVALTQHGRGYSFAEMPDVFMRVIGRLLK